MGRLTTGLKDKISPIIEVETFKEEVSAELICTCEPKIEYVEVPVEKIVEVIKEIIVEKQVPVVIEKLVEVPVKEIEYVTINKIETVEIPVEKIVEVEKIVNIHDISAILEEKKKTEAQARKVKHYQLACAVLIVLTIIAAAV